VTFVAVGNSMDASAKRIGRGDDAREVEAEERRRANRYPISRWYLRPPAGALARALAPTRVRPNHLTFCGLACSAAAVGVLLVRVELAPVAGLLVLAAWFFDRADGQLARRQQTASAWGAWLDANVDELSDVALHVAMAAAAASATCTSWPWWLLTAFLGGKYLFFHGLATEEATENGQPAADSPLGRSLLRRIYHLPGNADLRVHLTVLALATGWLTAELALVAGYYNLRWIARYVLVARRLSGGTA